MTLHILTEQAELRFLTSEDARRETIAHEMGWCHDGMVCEHPDCAAWRHGTPMPSVEEVSAWRAEHPFVSDVSRETVFVERRSVERMSPTEVTR